MCPDRRQEVGKTVKIQKTGPIRSSLMSLSPSVLNSYYSPSIPSPQVWTSPQQRSPWQSKVIVLRALILEGHHSRVTYNCSSSELLSWKEEDDAFDHHSSLFPFKIIIRFQSSWWESVLIISSVKFPCSGQQQGPSSESCLIRQNVPSGVSDWRPEMTHVSLCSLLLLLSAPL